MTHGLLDHPAQLRALRARVALEPVDGPDGRVFPPTVLRPGRDRSAGHVFEEGGDGLRVLIDSCAAQANRQELALLQAREAGRIRLADIEVDFSGTAAMRPRLSTLEMPHRVADAILRDSEIDGIPFAKSEIGQRILAASMRDLTPILETSPASLVFGTWFAQHDLGSFGLKLERASAGEIWGHGAWPGRSLASRIDPLALTTMPILAAADDGWTVDEADALKDGKGRPLPFGRKTTTSALNHANIPPTVLERGVTCGSYDLRWSLNGAVIRRQGFGSSKRDAAAHCYLLALGLAARVLAHEEGYALRSRCLLLSQGPLVVEAIWQDGSITEHETDSAMAIALLEEAQDGLIQAGFAPPKLIQARPAKRLARLIARSRAAASSEEAA